MHQSRRNIAEKSTPLLRSCLPYFSLLMKGCGHSSPNTEYLVFFAVTRYCIMMSGCLQSCCLDLTKDLKTKTLTSAIEVSLAIYYSAPDRGVEYCEERVCLYVRVCQSTIISSDLHVQSLPVSMHVTYGRGSVLLWRRNDTLCTSGFMDNIIFAQKPRLLDVAAQLKCSAHVALGLAVSCVH